MLSLQHPDCNAAQHVSKQNLPVDPVTDNERLPGLRCELIKTALEEGKLVLRQITYIHNIDDLPEPEDFHFLVLDELISR